LILTATAVPTTQFSFTPSKSKWDCARGGAGGFIICAVDRKAAVSLGAFAEYTHLPFTITYSPLLAWPPPPLDGEKSDDEEEEEADKDDESEVLLSDFARSALLLLPLTPSLPDLLSASLTPL